MDAEKTLIDMANLYCTICGYSSGVQISKLPLPSANTTCPKCKTTRPLYYFISSNRLQCTNQISETAINNITKEFNLCILSLNNIKDKYTLGCPLCNIGINIEITKDNIDNVTIETYYYKRIVCIIKKACPFCNTNMALYLKQDGTLLVLDTDFDTKDHSFRSEMKGINAELDEANRVFDDAETDKQIIVAQHKIDSLERKLELIQTRYDEYIDKYEEKKSKWRERVFDKYGDIGFYKNTDRE